MSRLVLALLGSNVDRERSLAAARAALDARFGVAAASPVYESPAVGVAEAPPFRNQALLLRSGEPVEAVRSAFRGIEAALGRVRSADRDAPRTLDIDLLLVLDAGGRPLADSPVHPDLLRRHYAAIPAADIAGGAVVPGDGRTLGGIRDDLGPPPPGFHVAPPGPVTEG